MVGFKTAGHKAVGTVKANLKKSLYDDAKKTWRHIFVWVNLGETFSATLGESKASVGGYVEVNKKAALELLATLPPLCVLDYRTDEDDNIYLGKIPGIRAGTPLDLSVISA